MKQELFNDMPVEIKRKVDKRLAKWNKMAGYEEEKTILSDQEIEINFEEFYENNPKIFN